MLIFWEWLINWLFYSICMDDKQVTNAYPLETDNLLEFVLPFTVTNVLTLYLLPA